MGWSALFVLCVTAIARISLAADSYVEPTASSGSFPIVSADAVATIFVDADSDAGLARVANDLKADIRA
jgi:hypothetical protein